MLVGLYIGIVHPSYSLYKFIEFLYFGMAMVRGTVYVLLEGNTLV